VFQNNVAGEISGFVITHGVAEGPETDSRYGAGVYCTDHASPTIRDNSIRANVAGSRGGGICFDPTCSPTIQDNLIRDNEAGAYGGGIACQGGQQTSPPMIVGNTISRNQAAYGGGIFSSGGSSDTAPRIVNCLITANAAGEGGGVACYPGVPVIRNCTLVGNTADYGGGVSSRNYSNPRIRNSILGDNQGGQLSLRVSQTWFTTAIDIDYSTVQEDYSGHGWVTWGAHNLRSNPLFHDPGHWNGDTWVEGDYHLRSLGGRYNPATTAWETDAEHSPCIDAGDPSDEVGLEPEPNRSLINMGAYGGTAEASKSWLIEPIAQIEPASGPRRTQGRITGTGFGSGLGRILFTPDVGEESSWEIGHWSDGDIAFTVPADCPLGAGVVRVVRTDTAASNPMSFTVTQPDTVHVDDDNTTGVEDGTEAHPYASIVEGVAAVADGGAVKVAQGNYDAPVAMAARSVLLRGGFPGGSDYAAGPGDFADAHRDWGVCPTTIAAQGADRCVTFDAASGEVSGFTLTQGGILCDNGSAPLIADNRILDSSKSWGAGIYCDANSTPTIARNLIARNTASYGGGIACRDSAATIISNLIVGNSASSRGGGVDCTYQGATLINNTIVGNSSDYGGGLCAYYDADPSAVNCILWGNTGSHGSQIAVRWFSSHPASATVHHCAVEGGQAGVLVETGASCTWGSGNTDADPLFIGENTGRGPDDIPGTPDDDYRLGDHSPCTDAAWWGTGVPETDVEGLPRYDDLGVFDGPDAGTPPKDIGACERQAHSPPILEDLSPDFGPPGTQVTITGGDFGEHQGTGYVLFGSIPAPIVSWSPHQIIVLVPDGLTPGEVNVTVTTDSGVTSDAGTFTAEEPPRATLTATVQLEGYSGSPGAMLTLRFIFHDAEGAELARRDVQADFTNGRDTEVVVIDDLPIDTRIVSCKEPVHFLRRRLDVGGAGSNLTADFTGPNQLLGGDLNDDNFVELRDFAQFLRDFGRPDCPQTDINGDGDVDNIEFGYIGLHFFEMGDPE